MRPRLSWVAHGGAKSDQSAGFTLVELLLAMALFSFVLLIVVLGVVSLIKVYQTGVADRRSQNGARVAMNQMVEFGRDSISFAYSGSVNKYAICMYGPRPTVFYLGGPNQDRLYQQNWDDSGPCAAGSGGTAVTPSDVAVVKLQAEQTDNYNNSTGAPNSCLGVALCRTLRIDITTTTNKNGLDGTQSYCLPTANFCSVTAVSTSVRGRAQL